MGMGALGRALAKGVSGAANMGAGLLAKDYERNQDTAARMTLEDHAAALREKLELQRPAFTTGERVATQDYQSNEARLGREHTAAVHATDREAADARAKADRESRERTSGADRAAADRRAAEARTIDQQRIDLDRRKQALEEEGRLPPDVKAQTDTIRERLKGLDSEVTRIRGLNDGSSQEQKDAMIEEIRKQQAGLVNEMNGMLGGVRADRSQWGNEGRGAIPSQRAPFKAPGSK